MNGPALFQHPFVSLHQDRGLTFARHIRLDHPNLAYPTNQRVLHHNWMGEYRPRGQIYSTFNFPWCK